MVMAELVTVKRVTIFADGLFEEVVTKELGKLGAKGFTCIDCRGAGEHQIAQDLAVISSRVRIEAIVQPSVADAIMDFIESPQYADRAFTVCVETVEVSARGTF
jgi:hypothetical protein